LQAFKSFEWSKVILRQRKKTFIVHECSVTQGLPEKSREVRSWFEVSEVSLPPLFSLKNFGIAPSTKKRSTVV